METIDHAVCFFVTLLSETSDLRGIPDLFLDLFRKWMKNSQSISSVRLNSTPDDWQGKFVETKLVQEMLEKFPEKLVSGSTQILQFVLEFLNTFVELRSKRKADGEALDQATLLLSLLHIVLCSPGFRTPSFQTANSELLSKIEPLLENITNYRGIHEEDSTLAEVARNLLQFLLWRDQPEITEPTEGSSRDKHAEDLQQRDLAMSYLTSLDSPPPVRAEGLHLLSSLIESQSIVLDINTTIHLLCSLLQAEEEYIYLQTIKTIVTLSTHHPKTVITTLLEKYIDADEMLSLDPRLRLGETLSQIISNQATHQNFRGPYTQNLGTSILHISSLRPIKSVAAAVRAKEERLQAAKDKQAADAWGGSVPDLEDMIIPKQEQEDNEILCKILEGWHGKRNSEDLRIRTSALAIFSTALQANVNAFSPSLISEAIDLCIMIMKVETSDSAAILRRAAIILILSLVQALDSGEQKAAFTFVGSSVEDIREVLGYIEATDGDGLVRRHAVDVRESLANWRDKGLLDMIGNASTSNDALGEGIGALRGLDIDPERSEPSGLRGGKMLIEEIE